MDRPRNYIRSKIIPNRRLYTIGDDKEYRERLRSRGQGFKDIGGVAFAYVEESETVIDLFDKYWGHEKPSPYGEFRLIARMNDIKPWPGECGLYSLRQGVEYVRPYDDPLMPWIRYWYRQVVIGVAVVVCKYTGWPREVTFGSQS